MKPGCKLRQAVGKNRYSRSLASRLRRFYDRGLRRARVDQYIATYNANIVTYRQSVLTAFQQVEESLAEVRLLSRQVRRQQEAVDSSQRFLRLELGLYHSGIDPYNSKTSKDRDLHPVQDQSENDSRSKFTGHHGDGKWCHGDPTNSQRRDNKKVGHRGHYHPYGRAQSPQVATCSYGVNRGLAAIDDSDDRKSLQGFHSESQFEFANYQDDGAKREKAASQDDALRS
jgi:hypothetical protein